MNNKLLITIFLTVILLIGGFCFVKIAKVQAETTILDVNFAYEKSGAASFTNQDDIGDSEATDTDYNNIKSTNNVRWTTEGAITDGHYDSQLYKFYINENESAVTQLDFTWEGYGETHGTGYPTDFYAWNYETSVWDLLQEVTFTAPTDQNLTGSKITDAGNYIDTDKEVTLMVKTKKYTGFANGFNCTTGSECASGNCKNGICCTGGQICCSSNTHCPADSCPSTCQKRDNYCDTTTDHYCKYTDSYLTTAGKVCSGGSEVAPTSGNKCDATINCSTNACSASRYYRGCTAGAATCTDTGRVSYTAWNASDGYVINQTTNKVGTSCTTAVPSASLKCNTVLANNNNCQYTTYYRACGGAGSCRTDNTGAGSAQTTCGLAYATKGATSCTGVTTANYCQVSTFCGTNCMRRANYYSCAGSGSTCETTARDTEDANCASGTYCLSGSCVSGYCATCGDCSNGSCTPRPSGTYASGCLACKNVCTGSEIGRCTGDAYNTDSDWGAGSYGCTGSNKRCYGASCITCGGWMNAGYCWYNAGASTSCTTQCSSKGGVYKGTCDWVNDPHDCSTCLKWFPGTTCWGVAASGPSYHYVAGWIPPARCIIHLDGGNKCEYSESYMKRQCACNE